MVKKATEDEVHDAIDGFVARGQEATCRAVHEKTVAGCDALSMRVDREAEKTKLHGEQERERQAAQSYILDLAP